MSERTGTYHDKDRNLDVDYFYSHEDEVTYDSNMEGQPTYTEVEINRIMRNGVDLTDLFEVDDKLWVLLTEEIIEHCK